MAALPALAPAAVARDASAQAAEGLAGRLKDAAARGDAAATRKAAQQFEAWFVKLTLREMRKAQESGDGLFSGSEMQTWSELLDEEIAGRVAQGRGLGLADMIVRQLEDSGLDAAAAAGPWAGAEGTALRGLALRQALRTSGAGAAAAGPGSRAVPSVSRGGWSWALPAATPGRLSSDFGERVDPLRGARATHSGLDVAAPRGTPVLAMSDGIVLHAGDAQGYGILVEIDHGDGVVARYAHQDRADVQVGQRVRRGEQIGAVGATGRATGDHLHLELRRGGSAVDPAEFLAGR
jgi:murein DD-endopeptidase MepM/ murein hydrolase activator NlpD